MRTPHLLVVLVCALGAGWVTAQSLRDPTVPPAAASVSAGPAAVPGMGALTVIVREGQAYLVVDTRLYAQGDRWGDVRIERISETEVWLRERRTLRKLPRFSGVKRRAAMSVKNVPHNATTTHDD